MEPVVAIANEIILAEAAEGRELDHIRLHKLLYYVQVYSLLSGEEAYAEELQAWDKGPMIPALRNFMLSRPNRSSVYALKAPLTGQRVQNAAIKAAIALALSFHGSLSTDEIIAESHENMLYHAAGRNEVINMARVRDAYIQLGPEDRLLPTPIHRSASDAEQGIISALNASIDREELLDDLGESNYPLLMSLVVTHRDILSERTMADVMRAIASSWWEAPRDAVNMLRVGLTSPSALVQERSLRGLASILESTWDEDVRIELTEYELLKVKIRDSLIRIREQVENHILAPYLNVTYRSLLADA